MDLLVLVFALWAWHFGAAIAFSHGGVADNETTTPANCQCLSICQATIDNNFTRDKCRVQNGCGQCLFGDLLCFDQCQYRRSELNDDSKTWQLKQADFLAAVRADQSLISMDNSGIFPITSMITAFENEWDVMPNGRRKTIHPVGAICPFEIVINDKSPYTGLLKPGKVEGLLRLGPAVNPWAVRHNILGRHLVPGAAMKFFRSGMASGDVLFGGPGGPAASIPNQNYNFFAVSQSNAYDPINREEAFNLRVFIMKFCQTGRCLLRVGISTLAKHDQDGQKEPNPNFPFEMILEPANVTFDSKRPSDLNTFMNRFVAIPVGSIIYKLRAFSSPQDTEGTILGDVVTTGPFTTSKFGDQKLFFRHNNIDEDVALRPEWEAEYRKNCDFDLCP